MGEWRVAPVPARDSTRPCKSEHGEGDEGGEGGRGACVSISASSLESSSATPGTRPSAWTPEVEVRNWVPVFEQ